MIQNKRISVFFVAALLVALSSSTVSAEQQLEIPYTVHKLKNGLTVIIHEDHKSPVVGMAVWYNVGSKHEEHGQYGLAHLYEHLMFSGSANFDQDYGAEIRAIGGTFINASTNYDHTTFYETIPSNALDRMLWLESDRMGYFLGALDQEKIDKEKGVVLNELNQTINQPYSAAQIVLIEILFPLGHPYHHPIIGNAEQIKAATFEQISDWFKQYYAPSNAVLTLAGDVKTEEALEKVEKYFGAIPPGPPVKHVEGWIPKTDETIRVLVEDKVSMPMLMMAWAVPGKSHPGFEKMYMAADLFARGNSSVLHTRLVRGKEVAVNVRPVFMPMQLASLFAVMVVPKAGVDLRTIEREVQNALEDFIESGPSNEQVSRLATQKVTRMIQSAELVGGKTGILASSQLDHDDPGYYKKQIATWQSATTEDMKRIMDEWTTDGALIIDVIPFSNLAASEDKAARSQIPSLGEFEGVIFPDLEKAVLPNGMEILVATRTAIPFVQIQLVMEAGFKIDTGTKPGLAKMTLEMLLEGTEARSAEEIRNQLQRLGASISTTINADQAIITINTPSAAIETVIETLADIVMNPRLKASDLIRKQSIAKGAIDRELNTPAQLAERLIPQSLFGDGDIYRQPLTGSGTKESVDSFTIVDIRQLHETRMTAGASKILFTGDVTLEVVKPLVGKHFSSWKSGDFSSLPVASNPEVKGNTLYLVNRPNSQQSQIIVATAPELLSQEESYAFEVLNALFSGYGSARINNNLRKDKGWSYGAISKLIKNEQNVIYYLAAPVQTDKTIDAIKEIQKELNRISTGESITDEELQRTIDVLTLSLPGNLQTNSAVAEKFVEMLRFDGSKESLDNYSRAIRNVDLELVSHLASTLFVPDEMTWMVIGDKSKFLDETKNLGFDFVTEMDQDGTAVK